MALAEPDIGEYQGIGAPDTSDSRSEALDAAHVVHQDMEPKVQEYRPVLFWGFGSVLVLKRSKNLSNEEMHMRQRKAISITI